MIGVLYVFLSACVAPSIDAANSGRTTSYEPGVPNFDMEAIVQVDGGRPAVEVHYSFPLASLVFVQSGDGYEAEYELAVRLLDRSTTTLVSERSRTESLSVASYDSTLSYRPHVGRLVVEADPGNFVAEAVLTDRESGASAERRQAVDVADIGGGGPFVGRILLEGTGRTGALEPIVSLHLPARMDSLRASIQLYNLIGREEIELSMSLVRFGSDTTVASPPYWLAPQRGSLAYRGIDYEDVDTIQVARRVLREASESAVVEFDLPRLERGLYRLGIAGRDASGAQLVNRERTFSVKIPTFPRMVHLDDLVESLAYIAYDNEIDAIREGTSVADRKRRFDAFWGALVSERSVAANLIELYYGRIEEANLLFTSFKEGWMTDRGMIFTVLGPPLYVDRRLDMEIWYYSYGDRDPANTFVFERTRNSEDASFENYILQRRPYYQNEWARAIDRWRGGEVL